MPHAIGSVTSSIARLLIKKVSIERHAVIGPLLRSSTAIDKREFAAGHGIGRGLNWWPDDSAGSRAIRFARFVLVINVKCHTAIIDQNNADRGFPEIALFLRCKCGSGAAGKEAEYEQSCYADS